MRQIIDEFVAAAKICRDAGFDAVEIHMGHGYLLNQFIHRSTTNAVIDTGAVPRMACSSHLRSSRQ